ncbi:MAG: dTDP-glucose 4,6-dehydratase [Dehalococcoidia bacterium]
MKALVTGGSGFIGSHVVRALLRDGWAVRNLDKLTYASNQLNLRDVQEDPGYEFLQGDICDPEAVAAALEGVDLVLNFAAESHVDRSLLDPLVFVRTDVEGVVVLLEALRKQPRTALVHMSTDEVFGTLPAPLEAGEEAPFNPSSPYSASKAAAELQIRAYAHTYGMPVTVLRCCNVYGPNQHIEKFIPLFLTRALRGEALPLYGDGRQEREWIFTADLVDAVRLVVSQLPATPGIQAVHVGSGERRGNLDVAHTICDLVERPRELITPVADRPGHDRRYALDATKLRGMGWQPKVSFEAGLRTTAAWYREHPDIWGAAASPEFVAYFRDQYEGRLEGER